MTCEYSHTDQAGKFCRGCGVKLPDSSLKCIQGHEMKVGSKFCGVCGSVPVGTGQVSNPTIPPSQPIYPPTTPSIPAFTPTPTFNPGLVQRTNGLAIASICLSCTCVCSPGGLIAGIIALNQINKNVDQKGKELAIAGIVVGSLGIVWLFFNLLSGALIGY
jgi:hypothetical protein